MSQTIRMTKNTASLLAGELKKNGMMEIVTLSDIQCVKNDCQILVIIRKFNWNDLNFS